MFYKTYKVFAFILTLIMINACTAAPSKTENMRPFPSLAPMIKKVHPSVVSISTFSISQHRYNPLLNDPALRHYNNSPEQRNFDQESHRQQRGAGSGVIVDAEKGIVMTNFHVVEGADEVQVSLTDGRSYTAHVLGNDAELDVSILEIDTSDLVQLSIADSSDLEVGDFVVAIGNPFALGQTVTTGVVSALGRSGLGIEGYESFIQTDASINPGNSGGALVNLAGELVGINTAIIAPAGGNVGIGFAIPSNMAKASMDQILLHGEVKRGQIGVGIQDITPDLGEAFDLENGQRRVLITSTAENSPAEKAGLKPGDVIIAVDGEETKSTGNLRNQIGMKPIGDKVSLTLLRASNKIIIEVDVESPQSFASLDGALHELLEGVHFEEESDGKGVLVTDIESSSIAAFKGLRPGDIIVAVNKRSVFDLQSFEKSLSLNKSFVLLQINRYSGSLFLVIR